MSRKIDYTSFNEWRKAHELPLDRMAEIARDRGVPVSPNTLGRAIRNGEPINGRVLFAWEDAFGWTREETLWLCMGGSAPRREERMLQTVMFSVEDLFELARRKE